MSGEVLSLKFNGDISTASLAANSKPKPMTLSKLLPFSSFAVIASRQCGVDASRKNCSELFIVEYFSTFPGNSVQLRGFSDYGLTDKNSRFWIKLEKSSKGVQWIVNKAAKIGDE